jgi:hypothetical protein
MYDEVAHTNAYNLVSKYDGIMNETLKHISFAYTGQWVENSIPFS